MAVTLCTSGTALLKAGSGANIVFRDANADGNWTTLINQAEAYLSVVCREDWVTDYSGLDANIKLILEEATSNLAAVYAIFYDTSGYLDRAEAEDIASILLHRVEEIVKILKDQQGTTYVKGA